MKIQKLMKQAQKMQEQMAEEMGALRVEGSSGGGTVTVTMDGNKKLLSVALAREAVDPDEVEMLEDLILAAVSEATRKVEETLNERLGGVTQGLLGQL